MKRFSVALSIWAISAVAFAGGIDNKTNLNAGYERNPSRNTECKRPEAVFYNIGGTAFMEDGLYLEAGNQFVFKKYSNELDSPLTSSLGINRSYDDKRLVYLYPNAEVVYKRGDTALFFGFGVFGGGGNLEYKKGTAATALAFMNTAKNYKAKAQEAQAAATAAAAAGKAALAGEYAGAALKAKGAAESFSSMALNHNLDVYSVQLGEIVGISSRILENLSLSVAARFMHGTQTIDLSSPYLVALGNGGDTIGYKADGYSVGAMFGIHFKPTDLMDLSVQYQSITRLNYRYHSFTGADPIISGVITNSKDSFANDLPAVLNLGAGYQVTDDLYASTSFNYYFNRFARIESPMDGTRYDYGNSWEIALGADYQINSSLMVSSGISYGRNGTKSDQNNIFSPVLDSFVVGAGCEYKVTKNIALTGSVMYCVYFSQNYKISGIPIELSKDITMAAIGLTFKPF